MITWVLVLWLVSSLLAFCFLIFVKRMNLRLLPDIDFLYRHAVMQQYCKYNCIQAIRIPPTASISKNDRHARLNIFYGDMKAEKAVHGDLVV